MAANVRAIEAGRAEIRYGLNTEDLPGEMARLSKTVRAFGKKLQQVGRIGAAAGGVVVGAFAGVAKQFASTGDHLDKMAQRTGLSVETLSELAHAAEQSGTDIDQLGAAIFRATRRIGNATTGTGPAVRALEELGLAADEVAALAPVDQFEMLVGALNQVENEARRSQLGFELFGDNWRQLTPLMNQGAEGIAALRQEARELGIVMSTEDATAAADLTDAMAELWAQVKGVGLAIGAAVAGPLTDFVRAAQPILTTTIAWIKENGTLVATIGAVAAVVTAASTGLVIIGTVMASATAIAGGLATAFGAVATAVTFLLSPLGLLVAGIVAVVAAFLWLSGAGETAINSIGSRIKSLGQQATAGLGIDNLGSQIAEAAKPSATTPPIPVMPVTPPDATTAIGQQTRAANQVDIDSLAQLTEQTQILTRIEEGLGRNNLVANA